MRGTELAVRVALTPAGAAVDRFCVRHFAHSPVSWVFARSSGTQYNRPILLKTVGRKTGRERVVVLPYFPAGEGRIAVVGSRGGLPTDPHWARNLRERPAARVHLNRREVEVTSHLAQDEERAALWKSITERAPVYLTYQKRAQAHREIPVFVLARSDGQPLDARF